MRSIVIVVVLPLAELVVEHFGVDAMRRPRRGGEVIDRLGVEERSTFLFGRGVRGFDVGVRDALVQMVVFWLRGRVDAQHSQAGAVVDGGELVVLVAAPAAAGCDAGDGLDELHVDLDTVAGQLLLVALPSFVVALVALRGGQSAHVQALRIRQTPGLEMVMLWYRFEAHRDLFGPEVIVLPQVDDLSDDFIYAHVAEIEALLGGHRLERGGKAALGRSTGRRDRDTSSRTVSLPHPRQTR